MKFHVLFLLFQSGTRRMGFRLWSLLRNGQGGKWLSGFTCPRGSLFCFAPIQHRPALPRFCHKKVSTLFLQLSLSTKVKQFVSSLHLSSLVVLTSSVTLLMELMKVLRSELWTSQRTKYSSSAVSSRAFRLSLVSRW